MAVQLLQYAARSVMQRLLQGLRTWILQAALELNKNKTGQ